MSYVVTVDDKWVRENFAESGFHRRSSLGVTGVERILRSAKLWLSVRAEAEHNELYRQIIPYAVLSNATGVLCYRRSATGGEARLHGRLSIGVGGHVEIDDIVAAALGSGARVDLDAVRNAIFLAGKREVAEELHVTGRAKIHPVGFVLDNATPVGRVHLGMVELWRIVDGPVTAVEDALTEVHVIPVDELKGLVGEMEPWSAMIVPHLPALLEAK